ncbi:hypothetical protein NPIL_654991, partial [Nephila pilipes]
MQTLNSEEANGRCQLTTEFTCCRLMMCLSLTPWFLFFTLIRNMQISTTYL